MLNIYIPKEPLLKDYGISEREIPEIEEAIIRPVKVGRSREDVLKFISKWLTFFVIYTLSVIVSWKIKGFDSLWLSLFYTACVFSTILIPGLIFFIINTILEHAIPHKLIYDTKDVYDEMSHAMMNRKNSLSSYKLAHASWQKDIDRINIDYPNATKIIPTDTSIQDIMYKWHELQYVCWCIKNVFMPEFKTIVENADNNEANRRNEDWWKCLSPYEFEKETGKWFLNKGYKVKVTQANIDGGVDIIVSKEGVKSYVQCKHYKDLVPVNVVRELKGVMSIDNVASGYLVCINGCTTGAHEFAKKSNIFVLTIKDLVNGSYEYYNVLREFKDAESENISLFKYGEYSIFKFAIKNLEDAETTIKNMMTWLLNREGRAFGIFKCYSFYIIVYSFVSSLKRLNNVCLVYDAVSGEKIYIGNTNNTKRVDDMSHNSTRMKYPRGKWRGYKRW